MLSGASSRWWRRLVAGLMTWALSLSPVGQSAQETRHAFPVEGEADYAEAHHDYPATDIFARCGERVVSPVDGVVLEVGRRDRWDPATDHGGHRGGKYFSIEGHDGVRYYGSHLSGLRKGIGPGVYVDAGELVGWVGRTGSAASTPCHLHLGLSPVCDSTGQWWIRRGVLSPYRYLKAWEEGTELSPAAVVVEQKRAHGCPPPP